MKKSPKQRAIEEDFGEPFWDVVKGFADLGESRLATSKILDYSRSAFYTLIERNNARHWFREKHESNAARYANKNQPGNLEALKKANLVNPKHLSITYRGVTTTLAEHCRREGVSYRTVLDRRRRWPDGPMEKWFSKTPQWVKPNNKNHRWR